MTELYGSGIHNGDVFMAICLVYFYILRAGTLLILSFGYFQLLHNTLDEKLLIQAMQNKRHSF